MKNSVKREVCIFGIIIFVGIAFLLADLFFVKDFMWKAYVFLTGGCTLSFYLVFAQETKKKKILSGFSMVASQSLIIAEFLTKLLTIRILLIISLIFEVALFMFLFRNTPSKIICSRAELQEFALKNRLLNYNIFSNAVCVCGATAIVYNVVKNVLPYIMICILMISLTVVRQFYSKKYFTKKPLAYIFELVFIMIGFCAVTLVAWISEISQSGLGFAFIYIMLLMTAYLTFDRPYVLKILETELNN